MNCPKCGSQLKESAKYCDECGTKIKNKTICPFCETEINDNDEKSICPECKTIYHKECWDVLDVCEKCKKIKCVETVNNQDIEIIPSASDNNFSIDTEESNNIPQQNSARNKKKNLTVIGIVIILITVCILLITNFIKTNAIDFSEKYSYMADEPYCTIASDGSYIELDSNPYDYDNDSYLYIISDYTIEVVNAVEQINSDLGFTQALSQKMNETNALQGKQFEENDKYQVTWTYHPDKGLNVIYEKK